MLQNTKSKCVYNNDYDLRYAITCFNYIHQNPLKAGLVDKIEDWYFSSYRYYAGFRNGTLINRQLAIGKFDIDLNELIENKILNEELIGNIW